MKVKYTGPDDFMALTHNQIYTVLSIEGGMYRILDDSGDDYLYMAWPFITVEGGPEDLPADTEENWWRQSRYGKRPGEEGYEDYGD